MYQRLLEVKEKGFARVTNPSLIQNKRCMVKSIKPKNTIGHK